MENASKALIIAGGILIAMMVVTILLTSWNKITSYQKAQEEKTTFEQLNNFNKEFESYNKGVVRGYELISLNNLIADTNKKYSDTDGYREMEAFVKFIEGTTAVTNMEGTSKQQRLVSDYLRLSDFMLDYYYYCIDDCGNKDYAKIFKESYFQCDKTVYNGEEDDIGNGSGRIQKLYFTQIERKE